MYLFRASQAPVALAAKVLLTAWVFFYFIKVKNTSMLCKTLPSSLPPLYPQEELGILYPSIYSKTFQTARKLPKWEKEMN